MSSRVQSIEIHGSQRLQEGLSQPSCGQYLYHCPQQYLVVFFDTLAQNCTLSQICLFVAEQVQKKKTVRKYGAITVAGLDGSSGTRDRPPAGKALKAGHRCPLRSGGPTRVRVRVMLLPGASEASAWQQHYPNPTLRYRSHFQLLGELPPQTPLHPNPTPPTPVSRAVAHCIPYYSPLRKKR